MPTAIASGSGSSGGRVAAQQQNQRGPQQQMGWLTGPLATGHAQGARQCRHRAIGALDLRHVLSSCCRMCINGTCAAGAAASSARLPLRVGGTSSTTRRCCVRIGCCRRCIGAPATQPHALVLHGGRLVPPPPSMRDHWCSLLQLAHASRCHPRRPPPLPLPRLVRRSAPSRCRTRPACLSLTVHWQRGPGRLSCACGS